MIIFLYGSQEGYIQLSVTGVDGTVILPGRAVHCNPVAVMVLKKDTSNCL